MSSSTRDAYGLSQAPSHGKKKKARDPRDVQPVIAAAKKLQKKQDADEAKALGPDPRDRRREEGNRTGLRNLGATCYMNSLLQTLHMDRTFRRGIFSWCKSAVAANNGGEAHSVAVEVCMQLQLLFANLQHSSLACYDPQTLTEALSLDTGVQQDAQEFNKLLLTFLEEQLALSPDPLLRDLVPSRFRGEFCYSTVCSGCQRPSASSATKYPFCAHHAGATSPTPRACASHHWHGALAVDIPLKPRLMIACASAP